MNIGDIVIPLTGECFSSGSVKCDFVIVVSIQPFRLVSVDDDVIFYHVNPSHVHRLCSAHPDMVKKAIEIYKQETVKPETVKPVFLQVNQDVVNDALIALNYGISYARDILELLEKDAKQMNQNNPSKGVYNKVIIEATQKQIASMIRARDNLLSSLD